MRNKIKDNPIKGLSFLYNTVVGRIILYPLVNFSFISKLSEKVMDSKISKLFIKRFIKNNNINMDEYIDEKYLCFNDFFIRNIKKDKRPINYKENVLIAPCDSKLTVYNIKEDGLYKIKNSLYSLENLLQDKKLSKEYVNGKLLVFRLSPDDYHHYYNIDNGSILKTYKIKGKYHTVNPIVYDKYEVFKENSREISIIKTENFDKILYIEVGALLVGKIVNNRKKKIVKGEEKGYFKYGGSTVILVFKENKIKLDKDILENSKDGYETYVKLGEKIGLKK